MPDSTLADRLSDTRAQLDALARALAHVDVEAIEASAQALAELVAQLPSAVATQPSAASPGDLDPAELDGLRWQLLRCRRLGGVASSLTGGGALYRPNGQTTAPAGARSRLEVAG